MRRSIPPSIVVPGHQDHALLQELQIEIVRLAGGTEKFAEEIPVLLRDCIDAVIETPRTGRRSYEELEKTEKTYIGTRVEIMLRSHLELQRGKLDLVINGHDVDVKHTMANDWMIPREAFGKACLLVAADEERAVCYLGLIVARPEYLRGGKNQDSKHSFTADSFKNILWLLRDHPYPQNFWSTLPQDVVLRIVSGKSGNERVKSLFREVQDRPISRDIINATARQKDFTRRVRADGGRGTRDELLREDIVLLSGDYGQELITALGLPSCKSGEWISHRLATSAERSAADSFLRST